MSARLSLSMCFLVWALVLVGCETISSAPAGSVHADHVTALGVQSLEPFVSDHFVFIDGQYIEVPYVISRRGKDIYLNEHLIRLGPEWPPYDWRVHEDPGPPPPGLSPIGPDPSVQRYRDGYWSRKARYLGSHYEAEQAKARMLETLRASDAVAKIKISENNVLYVTDTQGRESSLGFSAKTYDEPPTAEQWLEQHQASFQRSMQGLRDQIARPGLTLFRTRGGSSSAGHIRPILTDLLERPLTLEQRSQRSFTLRDGVDQWLEQFNDPHPQFVERAESYLAGDGR